MGEVRALSSTLLLVLMHDAAKTESWQLEMPISAWDSFRLSSFLTSHIPQ